MAPLPAMPMFTWLLLAIGSGGGTAKSGFYEAVEVEATEDCPRCDVLFSMLETTSSGKRVQNIKMQERGNVRHPNCLLSCARTVKLINYSTPVNPRQDCTIPELRS